MNYFHIKILREWSQNGLLSPIRNAIFFLGGVEGGRGWSKNNAKHGKVFKSRPVTIALEKTTK